MKFASINKLVNPSVALLLCAPLGHLHPARPPPLHHPQHPQGDLLHDEYAGVRSNHAQPFFLFQFFETELVWIKTMENTNKTVRKDCSLVLWLGNNQIKPDKPDKPDKTR